MFNRKNLIEAATAQQLQSAEDQATQAEALIAAQYQQLLLEQTHPWHANDDRQMQFVFASLAFVQDRLAENLLASGVVEKRGRNLHTQDIAQFAGELSIAALQNMQRARSVVDGQSGYVFDDDTTAALQPDRQLPFWPVASLDLPAEAWQRQSGDASVATPQFIGGVISAARALEADTFSWLTVCTNGSHGQTPDFYGSVEGLLKGELQTADEALDSAERLVNGTATLTDSAKAAAYAQTHDAFFNIMWAHTAVASPQFIGPEFRLTD